LKAENNSVCLKFGRQRLLSAGSCIIPLQAALTVGAHYNVITAKLKYSTILISAELQQNQDSVVYEMQ
jgi:hypothetical protein